MLSIIAAMGKNRGLGFGNQLPWYLPDDLKQFRTLTNGHPVIMGRKTFESIGKPLPNRKNIVVTRTLDYTAEGCTVVHSFGEALEAAGDDPEIFVIGGSEIYAIALHHADRMYLTFVDAEVPADVFFPLYPEEDWKEVSAEHHTQDEKHPYSFTFKTFNRV